MNLCLGVPVLADHPRGTSARASPWPLPSGEGQGTLSLGQSTPDTKVVQGEGKDGIWSLEDTCQQSPLASHVRGPVTSDCQTENHPKTCCCLKTTILYTSSALGLLGRWAPPVAVAQAALQPAVGWHWPSAGGSGGQNTHCWKCGRNGAGGTG